MELKVVAEARSLLGVKFATPSGKNRSLPPVGAMFFSQLTPRLQLGLLPPPPVQTRLLAGSMRKAAEVTLVRPAEEAVIVYVPATVKARLEKVATPLAAATVVILPPVNVPPAGPEV